MLLRRRTALRVAAAAALAATTTTACDSSGAPNASTTSAPPGGATSTAGAGSSGSGANPSPAGSRAPLPPEVPHGPRDRPQVALTFHGQGDPALVARLLAELDGAGAKVTVLAVGAWLAQEQATAKKILDGGHDLGNHTQNHLAIAKMDAAHAFAEINACADGLRKLTGSIGTWFRPSQTQFSTATVRAQAAKVGYPTCVSYDVDSLDYTDPGAAAIVKATLGSVQNGSIVSLHFGHAGTVTAMPEILNGLRSRGLRAVTMTELMR